MFSVMLPRPEGTEQPPPAVAGGGDRVGGENE